MIQKLEAKKLNSMEGKYNNFGIRKFIASQMFQIKLLQLNTTKIKTNNKPFKFILIAN